MTNSRSGKDDVSILDIQLDREDFSIELIASLSETLQDVLGMDEASGIISVVGQKIGDHINHKYLSALRLKTLPKQLLAQILIDLKNRIQGKFYLIYEDNDKIILGNDACPFAEKINGKPSLCMITSNVFGRICADNLGYAKVDIEKNLAQGDSSCRVVIYLSQTEEGSDSIGNEYFGG